MMARLEYVRGTGETVYVTKECEADDATATWDYIRINNPM